MQKLVPATVSFRDGALYSETYGDIYASAAGGLEETRHVFIEGNALPARWRERTSTTIVETGFGAGLNFLATWQAFRQHAPGGARLNYVSVERHPFTAADLQQIYSHYPSVEALSRLLLPAYPPLVPGFHRIALDAGRVNLLLIFGEAQAQLGELDAAADAFYLDGFAPSKNPDMWSDGLFEELARLAAPGATLATYSVAGRVRDGLARAGFAVQKRRGHGPKREMLAGQFGGRSDAKTVQPARAIVVGAGIAGSHCALALAQAGFQVDVLEAAAAIATAASANPAAVVRPFPSLERGGRGSFTLSAYLYAARHYERLAASQGLPWHRTGVLQLARDADHGNRLKRAVTEPELPATVARWVESDEAARLCGCPVGGPGLWFEQAGWLPGRDACSAVLAAAGDRVQVRLGAGVARIERSGTLLRLFDNGADLLGEAGYVVLANGHAAAQLTDRQLALRPVRGQVSMLRASAAGPRTVVCQDGYVTPAIDGLHVSGATFGEGEQDLSLREDDHLANLARARRMLPASFDERSGRAVGGWSGLRCASRDRRPLLGEIDAGLFACLALGSRGFTWAPLAGEVVASAIAGSPRPLPKSVLRSLAPDRLLRNQSQ